MNTAITYKPLTALFFIAVFFAHTFSRLFIIADYYVHTASYEKKCINKATPAMKCHGSCQMMKKLAQEEKRDGENPERKTGNRNEVLFSSCLVFAAVPVPGVAFVSSTITRSYADGAPVDRHSDIFHPPRYPSHLQV